MSKIVHFSMMLCIVIFVIWCLPFCTKITAIWLENKKHIEAFKYCCTSRDQKSRQATNWVVTSVTNVTSTTVLLINILNGQFPKLFSFLFCYSVFLSTDWSFPKLFCFLGMLSISQETWFENCTANKAKKVVLFLEIDWVKKFLSLTCPYSWIGITTYIFNFKKQQNKQK